MPSALLYLGKFCENGKRVSLFLMVSAGLGLKQYQNLLINKKKNGEK